MSDPFIGITMGDPAGVGPEIIAKFFRADERRSFNCVVFGSPEIINNSILKENVNLSIKVINSNDDIKPIKNSLLVYETAPIEGNLQFGKVSADCGRAAYDAIIKAIDSANKGVLKAIVTAPINKYSLREASIQYIGHTEILSHFSKAPKVFMLMVNDKIRVILCTIHVSLRTALDILNENLVYETIQAAKIACLNLGIKNPRIGVAGLNPHAGENGMMGEEEEIFIKPAIDRAIREGIDVSGPWPPDTVFLMGREGYFDMIVAQYHDQGLIPLKYLGFDKGVNITFGLPFVRTSPDHGTAFDIAGKGLANPNSFTNAFLFAVNMIRSSKKTNIL